MWAALAMVGLTLAAGVSVFGLENRGQTQRFLAHHGATAGLVWLVKVAVWGVKLLIISGLLAAIAFFTRTSGDQWRERIPLALFLALAFAVVALLFTVALICGMAFRRGITAFVLALVIAIGLAVPLLVLVLSGTLPVPSVLFVPLVLLIVSWAWSGDWIMHQSARPMVAPGFVFERRIRAAHVRVCGLAHAQRARRRSAGAAVCLDR